MNLTLEQKYEIILNTVKEIGSFQRCSCGCPKRRKPYFPGKPATVWLMANDALKAVGERTYLYDEDCDN